MFRPLDGQLTELNHVEVQRRPTSFCVVALRRSTLKLPLAFLDPADRLNFRAFDSRNSQSNGFVQHTQPYD